MAAVSGFASGPALSTITDTLYQNGGGLPSGTITISNPPFISADGFQVSASPERGGSPRTVQFWNGSISLQVVPTQGGTPAGVFYTVDIVAQGQPTVREFWSVPSSSTPLTINQVIVFTTPLPSPIIGIPEGGTGATTAAQACANLGCGTGGGGLTSFSTTSLNPIFSASLGSNPTTAPALTFGLLDTGPDTILGNFNGVAQPPSFGGGFSNCGGPFEFLNYYNHAFNCQPTGIQPRRQTACGDLILATDYLGVVNETCQGSVAIELPTAGALGALGILPYSTTIVASLNTSMIITPDGAWPIYLNGYPNASSPTLTVPGNNRVLFIVDPSGSAWDAYTTIGSLPPSFYTTVQYPAGTGLTQRATLVAGQEISATDNSTNGTTNLSLNPNDTTVIKMRDEFCSGSTTSGTVGSLGWSIRGSGPVTGGTGGNTAPYYCGVKAQSTASASTYGSLETAESSWFPFGAIPSNSSVTVTFAFSLLQTTNTRFYVGFEPDNAGIHPSDGIWLRYDTNATYNDTAFVIEACHSGGCTVGSITYAVNTNFHKVVFTSTASGSVTFKVDSNAPQTLGTNVTNASMTPFLLCGNDIVASQSFAAIGFFGLDITGLNR